MGFFVSRYLGLLLCNITIMPKIPIEERLIVEISSLLEHTVG